MSTKMEETAKKALTGGGTGHTLSETPLNGKRRAFLRGMANGLSPLLQIGKDGIGDALLREAEDALESRELIKVRLLDNSLDYTPRTAAQALAAATGSEVVQVIGSVFVLYRESRTLPREARIRLDGAKPSHSGTASRNGKSASTGTASRNGKAVSTGNASRNGKAEGGRAGKSGNPSTGKRFRITGPTRPRENARPGQGKRYGTGTNAARGGQRTGNGRPSRAGTRRDGRNSR